MFFDNTMIMSFRRKLFKEKDSVRVIKTQNHTTRQKKFLIICNNPRIASTKTQSIFCNKNVFCERQDSEKTNISWYQIQDIRVFSKQKSVSKLSTFENNTKVMKFQKNCQERGDRSLISHPSLLKKFESKRSRTRAFQQILHLIFWNQHLVSKLEHSN